jgi:hypothetical protein
MGLFGIVALAGVVAAVAAEGKVTFVNGTKDRVTVLVKSGPSGETGNCEGKTGQSLFVLNGGDKNEIDAGADDICWCAGKESDGGLKPERDCQRWNGASPGETVEIR